MKTEKYETNAENMVIREHVSDEKEVSHRDAATYNFTFSCIRFCRPRENPGNCIIENIRQEIYAINGARITVYRQL